MSWLPSRLIGAAINAQAAIDYPNQNGIEEVLATMVTCSELSLSAGGSCDTSCMQLVCRQALQNIWNDSLDESGETLAPAEIAFEAAGQPSLDDDAILTGFHGMWLGKVESLPYTAPVNGAISATAPQESGAMESSPKP